MKPIVEKVLRSGIVDKGMVQLLEKWGNLPEGASELLSSETLKDATKVQLQRFAEDIADEVAKEHILRETNLDLDKLKWPTNVDIALAKSPTRNQLIMNVPAVLDRMGRLFFRFEDVEEGWFTPGLEIFLHNFDKQQRSEGRTRKVILEVQPLFLGEQKIALQVATSD